MAHQRLGSLRCLGNGLLSLLVAGSAPATGAIRQATGTDSNTSIRTGPGVEHPARRINPGALPTFTN